MTFPVSLLNSRVVTVLMGNEEGRLDVASVRIFTFSVEDFLVQLDVVVVNGIVEGDCDHLGHVLGGQVAGDDGAIFGAEAIGQHALRRVARGRAVGVVVHICHKGGSS